LAAAWRCRAIARPRQNPHVGKSADDLDVDKLNNTYYCLNKIFVLFINIYYLKNSETA
jgi:hypothetical protein